MKKQMGKKLKKETELKGGGEYREMHLTHHFLLYTFFVTPTCLRKKEREIILGSIFLLFYYTKRN